MSNMSKQRSLGVTIISKIEMIIGGIALSYSLLLIIWDVLRSLFVNYGTYDRLAERGFGILLGLLYGIPAAIIYVTGKLTYRLKPAGRKLHLIISFGTLILVILSVISPSYSLIGFLRYWLISFSFIGSSIFITIFVFFVYFFTHPRVKEQFKE